MPVGIAGIWCEFPGFWCVFPPEEVEQSQGEEAAAAGGARGHGCRLRQGRGRQQTPRSSRSLPGVQEVRPQWAERVHRVPPRVLPGALHPGLGLRADQGQHANAVRAERVGLEGAGEARGAAGRARLVPAGPRGWRWPRGLLALPLRRRVRRRGPVLLRGAAGEPSAAAWARQVPAADPAARGQQHADEEGDADGVQAQPRRAALLPRGAAVSGSPPALPPTSSCHQLWHACRCSGRGRAPRAGGAGAATEVRGGRHLPQRVRLLRRRRLLRDPEPQHQVRGAPPPRGGSLRRLLPLSPRKTPKNPKKTPKKPP